MHVYTNILGREIPTYGLLIGNGVILANLIVLLYLMKKYKQDNLENFLILEAYTFLGAFIGAKFLYLLLSYQYINWDRILDIEYFNKVMQSGFVFYGGLLGGLLFLYIGGAIHKLPAGDYLRHYICMIPFIHSFGRIGCFEAGCCYGIPYSGYGAVVFPENCSAPAGIPLLPVQLIEAALLMGLAVIILILQIYKAWKYTIETYLISYGILRFVIEFFRFDEERGKAGVFSTSQIISVIVVGITVLVLRKRYRALSIIKI